MGIKDQPEFSNFLVVQPSRIFSLAIERIYDYLVRVASSYQNLLQTTNPFQFALRFLTNFYHPRVNYQMGWIAQPQARGTPTLGINFQWDYIVYRQIPV
jgi:hypothetical protein